MADEAREAGAAPPQAMLGVAGAYMLTEAEDREARVSKAGGRPAWLNRAAEEPPRCGVCGGAARLVVQLYAPVHGAHRAVYVFACNTPLCSAKGQGWTVLRGSGAWAPPAGEAGEEAAAPGGEEEEDASEDEDDEEEEVLEEVPPGEEEEEDEEEKEEAAAPRRGGSGAMAVPDVWGAPAAAPASGGGGDGGGDDDDDDLDAMLEAMLDDRDAAAEAAEAEEEAKAAAAAKKQAKKKGKKSRAQRRKEAAGAAAEAAATAPVPAGDWFAPFYLVPDAEPAEEKRAPGREAELLQAYTAREAESGRAAPSSAKGGGGKGKGKGGDDWAGEEDEEDEDALYDEFCARLARYPTQCVRSAYGSRPLWVGDVARVPPCGRCGAARQFEFQLMPNLLADLGVGLRGMDYGTVAVYSCSEVCAPGELVAEHAVVRVAERLREDTLGAGGGARE